MAWTAPRTWAAGEQPTLAQIHTHIRDNFNMLPTDDKWSEPIPLLNDWSEYDEGRALRLKRQGGFCYARGFIKAGTTTVGTHIAFIPDPYKRISTGSEIYLCPSWAGYCRIDYDNSGYLDIMQAGPGASLTGWVDIDIAWPVAP